MPYGYTAIRTWDTPAIVWRDWRWLAAPILTLFAVGLWLVPMLIATAEGSDPALLDYRNNILFHQTVTRYADSWGHIKPPWYLLTNAISWLWLPATLLLPWLGRTWWEDLSNKRNAAAFLLGCWVFLVVLFFSFSAGKRSVYIFPAAPAFALVVGCYMPTLVDKRGVKMMLGAFPLLLGFVLSTVGMYGLMHPHELHEWLPDTTVIIEVTLSLLLVGLVCMAIGVLSFWRRPLLGTAMSLFCLWLAVSLLVAPQINANRSGERLVSASLAALAPEEELALVGWPEQFLLYLNRPVTHFGYRRNDDDELAEALSWLDEEDARRVLVAKSLVAPCLDRDGAGTLVGRAHRRDWLLVGHDDLNTLCEIGEASANGVRRTYGRPKASMH